MMENRHFMMAHDGKSSIYDGGGWEIVILFRRIMENRNFIMAEDGKS